MVEADRIHDGEIGKKLCALGIAEEMRDEGIASNTLWPRTMVATAAVQNLLGGDAAMARSRKPEVYSDAAYVILNKPAREYTGNMLLCEDVLVESGVTDLSVYDCVPGAGNWASTSGWTASTRRGTCSRSVAGAARCRLWRLWSKPVCRMRSCNSRSSAT